MAPNTTTVSLSREIPQFRDIPIGHKISCLFLLYHFRCVLLCIRNRVILASKISFIFSFIRDVPAHRHNHHVRDEEFRDTFVHTTAMSNSFSVYPFFPANGAHPTLLCLNNQTTLYTATLEPLSLDCACPMAETRQPNRKREMSRKVYRVSKLISIDSGSRNSSTYVGWAVDPTAESRASAQAKHIAFTEHRDVNLISLDSGKRRNANTCTLSPARTNWLGRSFLNTDSRRSPPDPGSYDRLLQPRFGRDPSANDPHFQHPSAIPPSPSAAGTAPPSEASAGTSCHSEHANRTTAKARHAVHTWTRTQYPRPRA